jgi:tetratricopeptide (TPR) repeat protein
MNKGISAVLITKNEQELLGRCLKSLQGVDDIVVMDTGSTDNTIEIARGAGAEIFHLNISPFHFAQARNLAADRAENNWVISVDADEVLRGGALRKIRKEIEKGEHSVFNIGFISRYESRGKVITINKPKIFRRDVWAWQYRVHEQLARRADAPADAGGIGTLEDVVMEHLPTPDKAARREQNIELLKLCVKENPEYVRALKHLGQELMLTKSWADAIPYLAEFIEKTQEDSYQKSVVADLVAECYAEAGKIEDAFQWHEIAAKIDNRRREPYYLAATRANKIATTPTTPFPDALAYVGKSLEYLDKVVAIPVAAKPDGTYTLESVWGSEPRRQIKLCEKQLQAMEETVRRAGLPWRPPPRPSRAAVS